MIGKPKLANRCLKTSCQVKLGLVLACLILGAMLRILFLGRIPPSLFIDEYNLFADAQKIILNQPHPPWYGIGWYGTPQFSIVFFSWIIRLFGTGFYSFKIAWGVPAFLMLPIVFGLGKKLYNYWVGLLALLLLAVSYTHIHLSRWAHGAIIISTLNLASAWVWYIGVTKDKVYWQVLSAFFFALSIYTYVGARSFVLFFVLASAQLIWSGWWQKRLLKAVTKILVFGVTLLILLSPHIYYGYYHEGEMWARTRAVSILRPEMAWQQNLGQLVNNIYLYSQMILGQTPDPNLRHDPLQLPVLAYPVIWLAGMGLVVLILNKKWRQLYYLISLFIAAAIGGILSIEAPSIFRTSLMLPVFYILSGIGVVGLVGAFNQHVAGRKPLKKYLTMGLACLLVGLSLWGSLWQLEAYFALAKKPPVGLQDAFTSFENRLAQQVADELEIYNPQGKIFLSPDYLWFAATQYQAGVRGSQNRLALFEPTMDPAIWENSTLILDPAYESILPYLNLYFPEMLTQKIYTLTERDYIVARTRHLQPIKTAQKWGLLRQCQSNTIAEKMTTIDPTIFVGWGDQKPVNSEEFGCEWRGFLRIPQKGEYTMQLVADDYLTLELWDNDKQVVQLDSRTNPAQTFDLEAKTYRLTATYQNTGGAAGVYVYLNQSKEKSRLALPPLWLEPAAK